MLSYKKGNVPVAAQAADIARSLITGSARREQLHVSALESWVAGELDTMLAIWESILKEHPTDVLALRLAHFNNFWLGRPKDMRASVDRVVQPGIRNWQHMKRCCLPLMQGPHAEGIAWVRELERHWRGANNVAHHLWWHLALFHLARREVDAALDLYDHRFRDLNAALTLAQPDLYIDVQNAASMLFRLERQSVDVGERWNELADKAEQRIGDCLSAFTLPHWMMALAAAGRLDAAYRMIEAMRDFGSQPGPLAPIVSRVAVPVAEAILAHRQGSYSQAVEFMKPALKDMFLLGGSHAQQDVLEQLYLDAASKAGRQDDSRESLAPDPHD